MVADSAAQVLLHVLLVLAAVVVLGRAIARILRPLHQPPVIGEILAGILLGPSLLGPGLAARVLPAPAVDPLGVDRKRSPPTALSSAVMVCEAPSVTFTFFSYLPMPAFDTTMKCSPAARSLVTGAVPTRSPSMKTSASGVGDTMRTLVPPADFCRSSLSTDAEPALTVTRPAMVHYATPRANMLAMADELFGMVKAGHIRSEPSQVYALADAAEAHRALESRRTTGATVLVP